ncbi:hypothetical protein, partial [Providencia rettgeri]|uniref:hypothetical protein n=1 Tax=Providencia rettgeri TaxID=587 RepID=UPI00236271C9
QFLQMLAPSPVQLRAGERDRQIDSDLRGRQAANQDEYPSEKPLRDGPPRIVVVLHALPPIERGARG